MNKILIIVLFFGSIDSRFIYLPESDSDERPGSLISWFLSHPNAKSFPEDWPFADESLNYVTLCLGSILLVMAVLCSVFMFCLICRCCPLADKGNTTLVSIPQEMIVVGSTPSASRADNRLPLKKEVTPNP